MLDITRGTTPGITIRIPAIVPLDDAVEASFTIKQHGALILEASITNKRLIITPEEKTLHVKLMQEETLKMHSYSNAECGLRILMNNDDVWSIRDPIKIDVHDIVNASILVSPPELEEDGGEGNE